MTLPRPPRPERAGSPGDQAYAAACVDRWQQSVDGLVDPDGTVLRVLHAAYPDATLWIERLERLQPSPAWAARWTLEWAECPLELLVDPALFDQQDLVDAYHDYFHGGMTTTAAPAIRFLVTASGYPCPPRSLPALQELLPHPEHASPRRRFVVDMLSKLVAGVIYDALDFATLRATFPANPYEPELAMLARGLFPLAAHDGVCYVFRPAPAPVVVPKWLPHFTAGV
ncbi:MAG: hypothetical protein R3B09_09430 [Nannocystaceae bacterium]